MSKRISRAGLAAVLLAAAAAGLFATRASAAAAPGGKTNINQATAAQLAFLPRIGAKVAERIVQYRKQHGSFSRPEDLMEVKGIGEKLFMVLKPYVTVAGPTTVTEKIQSGSSRGARGAGAKKAAPAAAPVGKGR